MLWKRKNKNRAEMVLPDIRDMDKPHIFFHRCFATEDGKKALAFLRRMTVERTLGANAPEEQLRYLEGQRSIVTLIMGMIERARTE